LWEMRLLLIMSLFVKKERDNSVIEIQLWFCKSDLLQ
jgi:hypothetical protein